MAVASESDVQPERPVARRRRRLEVAHDPGGSLEVVGLGVHAAPAGCLPEVAPGHGAARAARAESLGPLGRQFVGGRSLAQSDEGGPLDEAPLRAGRRLPQRHDPRLLPQRGGAVDQAAAVEARLAADAVGTVELVKAALVVEQDVEAQPPLEQVEPTRVLHFPTGVWIADEHGAVGYPNPRWEVQ